MEVKRSILSNKTVAVYESKPEEITIAIDPQGMNVEAITISRFDWDELVAGVK